MATQTSTYLSNSPPVSPPVAIDNTIKFNRLQSTDPNSQGSTQNGHQVQLQKIPAPPGCTANTICIESFDEGGSVDDGSTRDVADECLALGEYIKLDR